MSIAAADLDRDGNLDVLTAGVGWYQNTDGRGTFAPWEAFGSDGAALPTDIDGDGDLDILAGPTFPFGYTHVEWYENSDGDGKFIARGPLNLWAAGDSLLTADLDGDGDQDLISSYKDDNDYNRDYMFWLENEELSFTR